MEGCEDEDPLRSILNSKSTYNEPKNRFIEDEPTIKYEMNVIQIKKEKPKIDVFAVFEICNYMWLQLNSILPFNNIYDRPNFRDILKTVNRETAKPYYTCIIGDTGSGKSIMSIQILIHLLNNNTVKDKPYYFYIHNDSNNAENKTNTISYLITPNLELYKINNLNENILLKFKHPYIVISDENIDITLSLIKNSIIIGSMLKSVIFTLSYKNYKICENTFSDIGITPDNEILKTIYIPLYSLDDIITINNNTHLNLPSELINKLYNQYGGDINSIIYDISSYKCLLENDNKNDVYRSYLNQINYDINSIDVKNMNITEFALKFPSPYWLKYKNKININRNIPFSSIYNSINDEENSNLFIHSTNNTKIEYKSIEIRKIIRNYVLPINNVNEYELGCKIYKQSDKYLLNDMYHDLVQYILPYIKEIRCKPYYVNNHYTNRNKCNIMNIPINHNNYKRNILISDNNIKIIKDEYSSFDLINNNNDNTINIDGYSYTGCFKICSENELKIYKDVNEYSKILNSTYNSLFIVTDKSIDDFVVKELDKYDDFNDIKYHPIIRKYMDEMKIQSTVGESNDNNRDIDYPSLIPSDYEVKYKSNVSPKNTIFNKNLEIYISSITIEEIELLKQNIVVTNTIQPTSVNGIFCGCVGWFSSSVPSNLKNIWLKEGGRIVDSLQSYPIVTDNTSNRGCYYLFADDSECDDVKDIFKNISFDMKGDSVKYLIRSEYIIKRVNNVNEKMQKYILPPHFTKVKESEKNVEEKPKSPVKKVKNNSTINFDVVSFVYEEKQSNRKKRMKDYEDNNENIQPKQSKQHTGQNSKKRKKDKINKLVEIEEIEEIEEEEEEEEKEEIKIPEDILKDYIEAYQQKDESLMKILQDLVGVSQDVFLNEIKSKSKPQKRKYK